MGFVAFGSRGVIGDRMVKWTVVVLLASIILACGGEHEEPYGMWHLSFLNGQAVLPQTQLTLELDDEDYSAFDGTNTTVGDYVYGKLEAGTGGSFFLRPSLRTDAGYFTLEAEEQAENYLEALKAGTEYRVVNGQLEVLDREGQTRLVLVRESGPR